MHNRVALLHFVVDLIGFRHARDIIGMDRIAVVVLVFLDIGDKLMLLAAPHGNHRIEIFVKFRQRR